MRARDWLSSLADPKVARVPMQRPDGERSGTIPEGIARLAYEQYSFLYGTSQSFERMNERGGFGTLEIIGLLADLVERERAWLAGNEQP